MYILILARAGFLLPLFYERDVTIQVKLILTNEICEGENGVEFGVLKMMKYLCDWWSGLCKYFQVFYYFCFL